MDKMIVKSKNKWPKYLSIALVTVGVVVLVQQVFGPSDGKTLKISKQQLVISKVFEGEYEDFIRIRGRVEPLDTLFLDAIEGGRVEVIYVEDGANVKKGQLLVELSNPTVQLNVIRTQADTTQQLNNLKQLELQMEQNRLKHKSDLVDINYNITLLESKLRRLRELIKKGAVQESEIEELEIHYQWYLNRLELTLESQETDERIQQQQMKQLAKASEQLQLNMDIAHKSIERLVVKAPKNGRITDFDLKVGESVGAGVRIGQIDTPGNSKLTANIDEFYINNVHKGQNIEVDVQGKPFQLTIAKVYPQVTNNQFKVDMVFEGNAPADIRRGQTLQGRLKLKDSQPAMLIKNGSFYQSSGGNWVFVVSPDGTEALKRNVKLGRRNINFIEVKEGLNIGEQVIASSYDSYKDMDRLKFNLKIN